jgi:hypothetical protein
MSRQVDRAEQEYESNNWCCVYASDRKLRKSESKWARRAEKNSICYLSKGSEMVHDMSWYTYENTNKETIHNRLCVAQLTASEISVLKIKAYLEDQCAQEMWAPYKFERGRKDFKPS